MSNDADKQAASIRAPKFAITEQAMTSSIAHNTEANVISAVTRLYSVRLFAALAGMLAAVACAHAAELSPPPPVAPVPYTWTGIYIGGNAGYAGTDISETVSGGGGTASADTAGFLAGGQIGGNYQFGSIVLGAEADFDGSTVTKSITGPVVSATEQMPWVGTFRGRLGVAFDRFLVYGTAGGAATELRSNVNAGAAGSASTDVTHGAWTAGGGVEYALTDSLSARLEYLYLDTGDINVANVGPFAVTGHVQQNIVRAGLNFRLPVAW
jgi:outer membrane immunogenic protein